MRKIYTAPSSVNLMSAKWLSKIVKAAKDCYAILLPLADCTVKGDFDWVLNVMESTGASMAYTDYYESTPSGDKAVRLNDWQIGSMRNDFDFGKCVLVKVSSFCQAVSQIDPDNELCAWYDCWLRLSEIGAITHLAECAYTVQPQNTGNQADTHFAYVDARNAAVQRSYEEVFTRHLKRINAYVPDERLAFIDIDKEMFAIEMSVIIPVRNRVRTIADALKSALSQATDFDYNVIVVDNQSTDGTLEIVSDMVAADPRLHLISTLGQIKPLGIGGCWNLALESQFCGRFAVQLDSDDLYSSNRTLQTIYNEFKSQRCAMVVGAYLLTDINGNELPPGVIDHKEYCRPNGQNNLLRVNGIGAPRAYYTPLVRKLKFPDVCYGEDYAMALAVSRQYHIGRILTPLYFCRRWEDNTDHSLSAERINQNNHFKDTLRSLEIKSRIKSND